MGDTSIFTDKNLQPDDHSLAKAIGKSYSLWQKIREYVLSKYPAAKEEWNYPGGKYGWSFRIKDRKRAIVYLLPRDKYFQVALVFGQKATDLILQSQVQIEIKSELKAAKVYGEGRGIRIVVTADNLSDIKFLVDTKLAN